MHLLPIAGCGVLGAGVVFLLIPIVLRFAQASGVDRRRELHHSDSVPVPRLGGLALVGAFIAVEWLVSMLLPEQRLQVPGRAVVIVSSLAMFLIGFWDDLSPLGARRKLFAQVLVAVGVHYAGLGVESLKLPFSEEILELNGWGVVLTILWLVGITNLLNLIDGVDGLAGGIGLMLMSLLVYVGYQNGTFVFLTAGMSGALLAFLFFNFPPARIYLGDGGAYLIGYQIAIFSLVSSHKGTVFGALFAPLLVLALPIMDTSLAILRRGLRGLPVFRPDRRHIHHRLLASGMSRRQVVLWLYGITLIFLIMGFVSVWSRGQLLPVLVGLSVLILLLCAGRLSFAREWFAVGRTLGNSLVIRQEVQYALTLMTWLRQEGARSASLEDLFNDLVFAARRLGFTSVKLKLADGERGWGDGGPCQQTKTMHLELQGGQRGQLCLSAPACMRALNCSRPDASVLTENHQLCDTKFDARLFEIMSELLAESWIKAAGQFAGDAAGPLRFDSKPTELQAISRRFATRVSWSGTGSKALRVDDSGARP